MMKFARVQGQLSSSVGGNVDFSSSQVPLTRLTHLDVHEEL